MPATGEALGAERKLIFENYVNGVDIEAMKAPFHRSAKEITDDIFFVMRKINEFLTQRLTNGKPKTGSKPPIAAETLAEIRLHRHAVLDVLRSCGPLYLSSPLLLPKIKIQTIEAGYIPGLREVHHRINNA